MREAVIVGYLRSPLSRSRPGGPERAARDVYNCWRMDEMAAEVVKELLKRTKVDPGDLDDFISGCALPVGENWTWGGRTIPLLAEIPVNVPAKMIDQQCCSSMSCIQVGAMEIMFGAADITMAVGIEHMTHIPMVNNPHVNPSPKFVKDPRYKERDLVTALNMGLTAEKLAAKTTITKEEMDKWSVRSHQLAGKALKDGWFKDELLPMKVTLDDGTEQIIDYDVSMRPDSTLEGMAELKPAFKEGGIITAGNSSPVNAGASAVLVMEKEEARRRGLKPLATVRYFASMGVEPSVMGEGPVPATRKVLEIAGMKVDDIDIWEINEAFAIVTLNAIKELGIDPDKVNIRGGAIAIGHPLGTTGGRITGTLARLLNAENKRWGCATACIGGGQGSAIIIEREDYDW